MGGDRSDRIYRISMLLDLSDMMEDLFAAEDSQVNARVGGVLTLIDKKAAREIACQARKLAKKDLLELAGSENMVLLQEVLKGRRTLSHQPT